MSVCVCVGNYVAVEGKPAVEQAGPAPVKNHVGNYVAVVGNSCGCVVMRMLKVLQASSSLLRGDELRCCCVCACVSMC
jgi:hypothetical protein